MHSLLVSVIIPVYNVEKYLNRCVDSVLNQSYKNIEVILINDGSIDNSPTICDYYLERDNRVKVIHQQNGGLSDARNKGIDNSIGDYIIFLDSDDYWLNSYGLEQIVDKLNNNNIDVLIFQYKKYFEIKKKYSANILRCDSEKFLSVEDKLKYLIQTRSYESSSWNKVIKRDLFLRYNLYFRTGRLSEDIEWSFRLATYAQTFDYYNQSFLAYVQRDNSITSKVSDKHLMDIIYSIDESIQRLDRLGSTYNHRELLLDYLSFQYTTLLLNLGNKKLDKNGAIFKIAYNYKFLLNYTSDKRIVLISKCASLVGLRITSILVYYFYKYKDKIGGKE